jgi:hypothetical protein
MFSRDDYQEDVEAEKDEGFWRGVRPTAQTGGGIEDRDFEPNQTIIQSDFHPAATAGFPSLPRKGH